MTNAINWFEIPVTDFARAKKFYETLFDAEIMEMPFPGGKYGMLPADMQNYGEIKLHLKEILEERNISLNQLSFRTEMQRQQLRNYRDNKIQRLDIDILKRLCYVLDCDLYELIEYIPPSDKEN